MTGFDVAKGKQTFGIPDDCDPVAAIAIDYLGDRAVFPKVAAARSCPSHPQIANEIALSFQ